MTKKASAFLFQITFAALPGRAKGSTAEAVEGRDCPGDKDTDCPGDKTPHNIFI